MITKSAFALLSVLTVFLPPAAEGAPEGPILTAVDVEGPDEVRSAILTKIRNRIDSMPGLRLAANGSEITARVRITAIPVTLNGDAVGYAFSGSVSSLADQKMLSVIFKAVSGANETASKVAKLLDYLAEGNEVVAIRFQAVGTDRALDRCLDDMAKGLIAVVAHHAELLKRVAEFGRDGSRTSLL